MMMMMIWWWWWWYDDNDDDDDGGDGGDDDGDAAGGGGDDGDDGDDDGGGDGGLGEDKIPDVFDLFQNYPNPFNPSTKIEFNLEKTSYIQLSIFNVVGQKIKTIYAGQRDSGINSFSWNARDDYGKRVASGIYFYLLEALSVESFEGELALKTAKHETKQMIYMR